HLHAGGRLFLENIQPAENCRGKHHDDDIIDRDGKRSDGDIHAGIGTFYALTAVTPYNGGAVLEDVDKPDGEEDLVEKKYGCSDVSPKHQEFTVREVHNLHNTKDQVQAGGKQDINAPGIKSPEHDLKEDGKIVHDLISTHPETCAIDLWRENKGRLWVKSRCPGRTMTAGQNPLSSGYRARQWQDGSRQEWHCTTTAPSRDRTMTPGSPGRRRSCCFSSLR